MKLVRFTLNGLSPGMFQNPATPALLESLRTKTPIQQKKDITLENDAKEKLYRSEPDENGVKKMGVPTQNIMSCLVIAGRQVKTGKKALSTAKETTIFGFLDFMEDFCPFLDCDPKGDILWKPFPMKGVMSNGPSSVAVCINRPRIPKWSLQFSVMFDETRGVDLSTLKALVEMAGRQVGLGDFRPAKRGRFGRFVVTKMEVLSVKSDAHVVEHVEYGTDNAPDDLKALAGI